MAGMIAALCAVALNANAFDPLFFVSEIDGHAHAVLPESEKIVGLRENRAYPRRTEVRTAPGAKVTLRFDKRNVCDLGSETVVRVVGGPGNPHWRVVQVLQGSVEVRLEEKFNDNGKNRVTIATPAAIGEPAVGGIYQATVTPGEDLIDATLFSDRGEMSVYDNNLFLIPAIGHANRIEFAVTPDKEFVRFHNKRGKVNFELQHVSQEDGTPKIWSLESSSVVKMGRRLAEEGDTWVVTMLYIASDGKLKESLNYSFPAGEPTITQGGAWTPAGNSRSQEEEMK
mgnify:FL=1